MQNEMFLSFFEVIKMDSNQNKFLYVFVLVCYVLIRKVVIEEIEIENRNMVFFEETMGREE